MIRFAVWDNIIDDMQFFDTREEADKCAAGTVEYMTDYAPDGWEGSEHIVGMEILEEHELVDITAEYRIKQGLDKNDPLPDGWDYVSELQVVYSRIDGEVELAELKKTLLGRTAEEWMGMYHVAANRADNEAAFLVTMTEEKERFRKLAVEKSLLADGYKHSLELCENMKLAREFEELLGTTSIPVAVTHIAKMQKVVDISQAIIKHSRVDKSFFGTLVVMPSDLFQPLKQALTELDKEDNNG